MGLSETFSMCFVSAVKDTFCQLKFRPTHETQRNLGNSKDDSWGREEPSAIAEGSEGLSGLKTIRTDAAPEFWPARCIGIWTV